MKLYKRFLAIAMVLVMIAGIGPVQAFADSATASFGAIGLQANFVDVDENQNGTVNVGEGGMVTTAKGTSTNQHAGVGAMWKDAAGNYYLAYYNDNKNQELEIDPSDITGQQKVDGKLTIEDARGQKLELDPPGKNGKASWHILQMSPEQLKNFFTIGENNQLTLTAAVKAQGFDIGDITVDEAFFNAVKESIEPAETPVETTYTVTYTDGVEDEEVFADQITSNLAKDAKTPEFVGDTPTRSGYGFTAWDPAVTETVTESKIYTAQWTENEVTISYVVDGEGGTVSQPGGEGAEQLDEKLACKTGESKGAVATADGEWKFEKWTVDDGREITQATLTPDLVAEYAKGEDGLFKDTTFTAHFAKSWASAKFYYLKSASGSPSDNAPGAWSPSIGEGTINLEDIDFKGGTNCVLGAGGSGVILEWPANFDNGVVSRNSEHFGIIFDSNKSSLDDSVNEDDVTITLTPYKISDNTDGYHVDCTVTLVAQGKENEASIRYVAGEGGTVSWPGEESAEGQTQLLENIDRETGEPKGAVAKANDGWKFEKWTVDDGSEITDATLTPDDVVKYAKGEDNLFKGTTFTAHFEQVEYDAFFYFALTLDTPLDSNEISVWGPRIPGSGRIDLTGAEFNDINCNIQNDSWRVLQWPEGFEGGIVPIDINNATFAKIFDNHKSKLGDSVTVDDILSVTLIPYKISDNRKDKDGFHVDCAVRIEAIVYSASFWLWDAGADGYTKADQQVVRRPDNQVKGYNGLDLALEKTDETGRPYHLSGWYTDYNRTSPAEFPYTVTGDVDFYARYIPDPAVTYDLNGGAPGTLNSSEIAIKYYSEGDEIFVAEGVPTREGYTFDGWTSNQVPVTDGKFTMPDQDVTLVAQWKAENYRLYYDINGGIATDKPENKDTFHIGDSAQLSSKVPGHIEKGVIFAGWTLDESAIGKIYNIGDAMPNTTQQVTFDAGDITVYAVWSYDTDGDHRPDVTERALTITGNSDTVGYNGLPREVTGYTAVGLDEGHRITVLNYTAAAGVDANTTPYEGSFDIDGLQILDASNKNVTEKYFVKTVPGKLTINPAPLTVTTPSATKLYDGTALTAKDGASITGFVNGETATLTVTGTQTEPGSSDNTYSITWDNAKMSNYTVTSAFGTLTVEPAHRLTVLYLYADGTPAADPYSTILPVGQEYRRESPEVEGFTANAAFVSGTMGNEDVIWTITYTAVPADNPVPVPPVVVDTPDGPIEADPNPDGGIALDPGGYTLIPVNDEGTPLANLGLDGHVDCALHFLLMLAAMLVVIAYTGSMKKHQKKLQELTEKLELEKKRRGVSDGSGEKE